MLLHANLNAFSFAAANVASRWLDLLQQDIKGRLAGKILFQCVEYEYNLPSQDIDAFAFVIAALRRSKKRVRNVIQIELPYVLSTEFSSNQENRPCFEQSSEAGDSKTAVHNMHVKRWKSLFGQMDKALTEEGKYLVSTPHSLILSLCRELLAILTNHGASLLNSAQKLLVDICLKVKFNPG